MHSNNINTTLLRRQRDPRGPQRRHQDDLQHAADTRTRTTRAEAARRE